MAKNTSQFIKKFEPSRNEISYQNEGKILELRFNTEIQKTWKSLEQEF